MLDIYIFCYFQESYIKDCYRNGQDFKLKIRVTTETIDIVQRHNCLLCHPIILFLILPIFEKFNRISIRNNNLDSSDTFIFIIGIILVYNYTNLYYIILYYFYLLLENNFNLYPKTVQFHFTFTSLFLFKSSNQLVYDFRKPVYRGKITQSK